MIASIVALTVAFIAVLVWHFLSERAWAAEREALVVLAKAQTKAEVRDFARAVDTIKHRRKPKAEDPDRPAPPTKGIGL